MGLGASVLPGPCDLLQAEPSEPPSSSAIPGHRAVQGPVHSPPAGLRAPCGWAGGGAGGGGRAGGGEGQAGGGGQTGWEGQACGGAGRCGGSPGAWVQPLKGLLGAS